MKDIERLADHYANYKHARLYPQANEAKAALLAAIGKLVSSTQPDDQTTRNVAGILERAGESPEDALRLARHGVAQSQDATQPVATMVVHADHPIEFFVGPGDADLPPGTYELTLAHPPIPREGKVMEALTKAVRLAQTEIENITDTEQRILDDASDALALLRSRVQGGLSTNNEEMK
jgi:hypothetical protein